MKRKLIITLSLFMIASASFGQSGTELVQGEISFITSRNIYVKFNNTEYISVGDTLWVAEGNNLSACLSVSQKSSSSCVCEILNDCKVEKGQVVYFEQTPPKTAKEEKEEKEEEVSSIEELLLLSDSLGNIRANKPKVKPLYTERIRGRLSAASYSSFSDDGEERHRMMYRFSLNASHINQSKFSVESYLNYRQNFLQSSENLGQQTKFFRVYNLAVRYDVDSTLSVVVGRKINNKASSLGAIDGVQAEKYFGKNFVGVIAGFRPDIFEYSFNPNLFQYGIYAGRSVNTKNVYAQSTLGLLEQRNSGAIDRRYVYFQHSSTINSKLSLFGSLEFDIYNTVNADIGGPRLTNLYLSTRYRFSRTVNVSIAYDSRKRILFYETLKSEIEQMLDDDEARQGLRVQANVRPAKYLTVGASYSKRFQSDRQNKSDNINGFVSWSKIPVINGRVSLNYNKNSSNYLSSNIVSLRHSRILIENKVDANFYYRFVNYSYLHSETASNFNYYGANFSYRINRKLTFSVLGELATRFSGDNYRVNLKLIKRFDNK